MNLLSIVLHGKSQAWFGELGSDLRVPQLACRRAVDGDDPVGGIGL
jgi:hypothetical protein